MHIKECISKLSSEQWLIEGWLSKYDFSEEEKENSQKEIIGKINNITNLIFEELNYSLLSGDFINVNEYKDDLKHLKSLISAIQSSIEIPNEQLIQDFVESLVLNSFALPLNRSLSDLTFMTNRLERGVSMNGNDELIVDAITSKNSHRDVPIDDNIRILLFNIKLTELDRNLSVNKNQLKELIIIRHNLDALSSKIEGNFLLIMLDKCNYLIRKILYRLQQDKKTSYLYAFDFQDNELTIENVPAGCFEKFDLITKKHYSIEGNNYSSAQIENIHEKIRISEKLNCIDFHHLTKVYKDQNKNDFQVSNLFEDFKSSYKKDIAEKEILPFDKRAYKIIKNYLANNKFSIIKENHSDNIELIEIELKETKQIQDETDIKNYFPYLQYSIFLENRIQKLFDKKENFGDGSSLSILIEKFKESLKIAYINFEWSKDRNLMAFQLPFKECCFEDEKYGVKLFLSSSFVLPINYEKILIELEELNQKLIKHTLLYDMHLNLQNEKDTIIELKTNVEKAERNSIQILGIFSAIVLFSASSIQIFKMKGMTPDYAIKFMLAFGYSLVLFIFLIWLISRDNLKNLSTIHKSFFVGLSIVTCIALYYVTQNGGEIKSINALNSKMQMQKSKIKDNNSDIKNLDSLNNKK